MVSRMEEPLKNPGRVVTKEPRNLSALEIEAILQAI